MMPSEANPNRAIVIGGSIAGLLSARVLSETFAEVIIVERDWIGEQTAERKGVPQSPQPHILLSLGYRILKSLFPSLDDDLIAAGAVPIDWGQDFHYFSFGGWNATHPESTDLKSFSCTRPLLENIVRKNVEGISNVRRLSPYRVESLVGSAAHVTGIQCKNPKNKSDTQTLLADLVVDASGRSSNATQWLARLGAALPKVETVDAGLGYATRRYQIPTGYSADWKVLLVGHEPPGNHRLGYLAQVEDNQLIATLGGYCKQYPPLAEGDFLAAAKALPTSEFYDAIARATPTSEIKAYRSTANKLRHYETLGQMPDGFVAIGDAVCALCPAYGQGLTTSGMSAMTLRHWIATSAKRGKPLNPLTFQKALAKKVKPAWTVATQSDSGFDAVKGGSKTTPLGRVLSKYMQKVIARSHTDSDLNVELAKISHMVDSPAKLFHPRTILKALS